MRGGRRAQAVSAGVVATVLAVAFASPGPSALSAPLAPAAQCALPDGSRGGSANLPAARLDLTSARAGWLLTNGLLRHTGDGGRTWPVALRQHRVVAFATVGTQEAWAVGLFDAGVPIGQGDGVRLFACVYRTNDSGRTWRIAVLPGSGIRQMAFSNPMDGWALSEGAFMSNTSLYRLYRTTDGGRRWHLASTDVRFVLGRPPTVVANAIPPLSSYALATDGANLWVAGTWVDLMGSVALYRSADGGARWQRVEVPVPRAMADADVTVLAPVFAGRAGTLAVLGWSGRAEGIPTVAIFGTRDGGRRWTLVDMRTVPDALPVGTVIDLRTPREVWLSGTVWLWSSGDGGHTWRLVSAPHVTPPWYHTLGELDFVSARLGFALSEFPGHTQVAESENGGRTWAVLYTSARPAAESTLG